MRVLSENGNPGRKEFTPKMAARWDALHAAVRPAGEVGDRRGLRPRRQARVDSRRCSAEVKDLEAVLYKIADYDVARMIRRASRPILPARMP